MSPVVLIFLLMLLLQLSFAAAWLLSSRFMDQSGRAARHMGLCCLLSALAVGLMMSRGHAPTWLAHTVANLLAILVFMSLRRGVELLLGQPLSDREQVLVLLLCGVPQLLWAGNADLQHSSWAVLGTSVAIGWSLLRLIQQAWPPLRQEFGPRGATLLLSPHGLGAAMYVVRFAGGVVQPERFARPIDETTAFNLLAVLVLGLLNLALNVSFGVVIQVRLVRRLQKLSQVDSLTGLLNRRELLAQLAVQRRWQARFGEPYALLLVDVDHFKRINDSLGHAAGDAALVQMSQHLLAASRQIDVVARLGGEEFCILLPRTGVAEAMATAERLRQCLRDAELAWIDQRISMTVSIGVAVSLSAEEAVEQVLARADLALYRAKDEGRDRICLAG